MAHRWFHGLSATVVGTLYEACLDFRSIQRQSCVLTKVDLVKTLHTFVSWRSAARPCRIASLLSIWFVSFLAPGSSWGADFSVTSPGSSYTINSQASDPTLTLVRGQTYTFAISTSTVHPFRINSTGVQNNNISSGTITFTVPLAASNYIYECSIHHFSGRIVTVDPPSFRILSLKLGDTVEFKSLGASNWTITPEFSTDLNANSWRTLTVQSNRFSNGTNEVICGRPAASEVFIRVKAAKN